MPVSPYVVSLRARVGAARLLLPSVSVHIVDDVGRLLLVQHVDDGAWSTPGGLIEPDEIPADAAVREAWEETGLHVRVERLLAVYAGPECVVRYPNGDETQYVIVAVACAIVGGQMQPDRCETTSLRFWTEAEAVELTLTPWLRAMLSAVYARPTSGLQASTWSPPTV